MTRKRIQHTLLQSLLLCCFANNITAQSASDFAYVLLRGIRESAVNVSINNTESGKIFPGLSRKIGLPSAGNFRISLADATGKTFDTTLTISASDAGKTFQIRFPDATQVAATPVVKQEAIKSVVATTKTESSPQPEQQKPGTQHNSPVVTANTVTNASNLAEFTKLASELTVFHEEIKTANENAEKAITELNSNITTFAEGIPLKNALLAQLENYRDKYEAFVEPAMKLKYTSSSQVGEVSIAIGKQQTLLTNTRSQIAIYQNHMDSIAALFDKSILLLEKTLLDFGKLAAPPSATSSGNKSSSSQAKNLLSLLSSSASNVAVDQRIQSAITELKPLQQESQKLVNELSSSAPVNLADYQKKLAEHNKSHDSFVATRKELESSVEKLKKNSKDEVAIKKADALLYEFQSTLLIYKAQLMTVDAYIKSKSGKR